MGVILFNHSEKEYNIAKGDRIAQLICTKISYPEILIADGLDNTVRGGEGFGST